MKVRILILMLCTTVLPLTAQAQQKGSALPPAIPYAAQDQNPVADTEPETGITHAAGTAKRGLTAGLRHKVFIEQKDDSENTADANSDPEMLAEENRRRIWVKYRTLAAGKEEATPEEQAALAEHEAKKMKEKKIAPGRSAAPPQKKIGGMSNIIEQYQESRRAGSQMKSMTVTAPGKFGEKLKGKSKQAGIPEEPAASPANGQ